MTDRHGIFHRNLSRRGAISALAAAAATAALPSPAAAMAIGHAESDRTRKYRKAALKCVDWLASQLDEGGAYPVDDVAVYYKSTALFHLAGRNDLDAKLLDLVKARFLQPDGDFLTAPGVKSADGVLSMYYPYINGWIAMASQRFGRFDIARPARDYLATYSYPSGGFGFAPPGQGDDVTDVFLTSHLGLLALYSGDVARAEQAGDFVLDVLDAQPDLDDGLYLRVDASQSLITSFPADLAPLCVVKKNEPYQLYFFVGYPIAFLAKLYLATGDADYLAGAQDYLAFAQGCHPSLYSFNFSHKLGWAASLVARITGDPAARETAERIADYLLSIQHGSGGWLLDQPALSYLDQSAEIATWLLEISAELG